MSKTAPADKCSRTIQKLSVATTPRRESSPNRASSSLRSAIAGPSCLGGEHVLDGDAGELLVAHRVGDGDEFEAGGDLARSLSRHRISHWLRGARLASTLAGFLRMGPRNKESPTWAQAGLN